MVFFCWNGREFDEYVDVEIWKRIHWNGKAKKQSHIDISYHKGEFIYLMEYWNKSNPLGVCSWSKA